MSHSISHFWLQILPMQTFCELLGSGLSKSGKHSVNCQAAV